MKIADVFDIEKVWSGIYGACRQHDDFSLVRSRLHPFELVSESQKGLVVDDEKNTNSLSFLSCFLEMWKTDEFAW